MDTRGYIVGGFGGDTERTAAFSTYAIGDVLLVRFCEVLTIQRV